MNRRSFLSALGLAPLAAVVPAFASSGVSPPPVIGRYEVVEVTRGMTLCVCGYGPLEITEVRLGDTPIVEINVRDGRLL